jgi:hypothetical protein
MTTPAPTNPSLPNGPAWAALIAAALGGTSFGIITDASECSTKIASYLLWYRPAGALSGVAATATLLWLLTWTILHLRWRTQNIQRQTPLAYLLATLLALAFLTTFPPFYELLGG